MPKRRRLLILGALICLLIFVVTPSLFIWSTRFRVWWSLRSAAKVRLEEFAYWKVLNAFDLTPTEHYELTDAMSLMTWDCGIPGNYRLCFIPHHRVIFTDASGREISFRLCFECDQMHLTHGGILDIPKPWRQPLREFFIRHGIPVREKNYPYRNALSDDRAGEEPKAIE